MTQSVRHLSFNTRNDSAKIRMTITRKTISNYVKCNYAIIIIIFDTLELYSYK